MQGKNEVYKSVEFAVKWWADKLDGTAEGLCLPGYIVREFSKPLEERDDNWRINNLKLQCLKAAIEEKIEARKIDAETKERFGIVLSSLIMDRLKTEKECCLFSDHDGAFGLLAQAARCCCIETSDDCIFRFFGTVEMFVSKEEVSARFDEDERYSMLFHNSLCVKSSKGLAGKAKLDEEEVVGKENTTEK